MPWGAAIAAVGAIGGALISSSGQKSASSDAANAQVQATNAADATQLQMFDQVQKNLAPWQTAGGNALTALQGQLGLNADGSLTPNAPLTKPFNYTSSPGLNASIQAGTGAVLNNRSALGGVNSGNTLRELMSVGQQSTYQDYWNQYNAQNQQNNNLYQMLSGLSGQGQSAAAGVSNAGVATGNNIAANQIGAGNAQAAGIIGGANATSGAINNSLPYLLQALQSANLGGGGSSYNYQPGGGWSGGGGYYV